MKNNEFIDAYLKIISEASKGKKEKHGHISNASISGPFRRLLNNEDPDKLKNLEALINGDKADVETIDEFIEYLKGICEILPVERAEHSDESGSEDDEDHEGDSSSDDEEEPEDDSDADDEVDEPD